MTLQISTLKANAVYVARMRAIHFRFGTNHFKLEHGYASAEGEAERKTSNLIAQCVNKQVPTSSQQGQTARELTPAAASTAGGNVSEKQLLHCDDLTLRKSSVRRNTYADRRRAEAANHALSS